MSRYCQDTNIPSVNEEAIECCETTPSNCVVASEAIPCLQLGKGDTLTKALVNMCKRIDQQNNRIAALELEVQNLINQIQDV